MLKLPKKIMLICLAAAMLLPIVACTADQDDAVVPTPEATPTQAPESTPMPTPEPPPIPTVAPRPDISGTPTADLTLPSLAEAYKDYFLIGGVFSRREIDDEERFKMLSHHYNVLTAENAMKPDAMQNRNGFTFDAVDKMLETLLENDFAIVGHTLAWHNQSPAFLNKDSSGKPLTRAEAEESLRNHIEGVAGHYAGKILAWDVINEAIQDGSSTDWRVALRRNDWFNAFDNGGDGTDYIEFAFRAARKADPNAKLYYNDYNLDGANKAAAVANMVKEINDKYLAEGNTRLLIEGVGMQGHYSTQTSIRNVERSIERFIELGVEISITELDIGVPSGEKRISEDFERGQALKYAELMAMLKKYSDHIARVTLWGLCDEKSWRADSFPLLFNRDFSPKYAYYAFLDPEGYLEEYADIEVITDRTGTAAFGTPKLDAENPDALWENAQMLVIDRMLQAWSTARGYAKVLWDDNNLYVLFEVTDSVLDTSSSVVHEVDSVEAFVDWTNCKTGAYGACDGQYRVSCENVQSFGANGRPEGFESDAFIDGGVYRVVMKIPAGSYTPKKGLVIGFDAQINDARDGTRIGISKWNDATDNSWQDNSNWGTITFN